MLSLNRRDFLRAGGLGLAGTMVNGLWSDLLAKGIAPPPGLTLFEERFGITRELMSKTLEAAGSKGADFAELFFEYKIVTSVRMEEDIIKDSSEGITLGVGIRVIKGAQTGYGYTDDLSPEKMRQTALSAAAIAAGSAKLSVADLTVKTSPLFLYDREQPLHDLALDRKVDVVRKAYAAAQSYDRRITKVQVTMGDEIQYVTIVNSEGLMISDVRPQAMMIVSSTAEEKGIKNTGFKTAGGRVGLGYYSSVETPESIGRKASEDAILLLSAIDPPAGDQPVVLGSRQSGVMIHEAVGHPLEADGNRKKTSIMWDKLGKQVANQIVTIFDDPTIPHSRGSMNVDDEGIVPMKTPLIDRGTLVGFLQDRLSAKLMGMSPNGHGRRMSFRYAPIPRMANTVLAPGDAKPDEIIRSVKKGFFAETYQGGQVSDSGKFTFSVNMGYLIEDGKLTRPVKNATLIGTNVQILNEVEMIGNDTRFFLGSCGKDGQSAAVSAGTPTLKIRQMTVGGRA
jgi:TldD protein